jgi:hypothetical protein
VKGDAPAPRTGAAVAYDTAHQRLVVFGGRDSFDQALDDLWELRLLGRPRWRRVPTDPIGPLGRYRGTLTPIPGPELLLYGGQRAYEWKLHDLWRLSLETLRWTPAQVSGPEPIARDAHSAVYCPDLGGIVVFGGEVVSEIPNCFLCYENREVNDLWLLTLGDWRWHRLEPSSLDQPCPTQGHVAMWDGATHRVLVFGGGRYSESCSQRDPVLWSFSPSGLVWSRIESNGTVPRPRSFVAGAFDARSNSFYLHGGQRDVAAALCYSDTWRLAMGDRPTWELIAPTRVPPLFEGMVLDPRHDRIVTAAGPKLWSYDLETSSWSFVDIMGDTLPSHRGMVVLDSKRDRLIAFGGFTGGYPAPYTDFPEVWSLNLEGGARWTRLPTQGESPATLFPTGIYDPAHDRLLVVAAGSFGGHGGTFELPLDESRPHVWTSIEGGPDSLRPWSGLIGSVATYESRRNRMLVFGGAIPWVDGVSGTNGCWALRLDSAEWQVVAQSNYDPGVLPSGRELAAVAYEPTTDRMLMVGGFLGGLGGGYFLDDSWALDLGTASWQQLRMETNPHPRWSQPQMFYDPTRDRSLVMEGDVVWAIEHHGPEGHSRSSAEQEAADAAGPLQLELEVRPNPIVGRAVTQFTLPVVGEASIELLDVAGRRVWGRDLGTISVGVHSLDMETGVPLGPGVYFVRLTQAGASRTIKLVQLER